MSKWIGLGLAILGYCGIAWIIYISWVCDNRRRKEIFSNIRKRGKTIKT
jgi:hypothetical protein